MSERYMLFLDYLRELQQVEIMVDGLIIINIELENEDKNRFLELKEMLGVKFNTEVLRSALKTAHAVYFPKKNCISHKG